MDRGSDQLPASSEQAAVAKLVFVPIGHRLLQGRAVSARPCSRGRLLKTRLPLVACYSQAATSGYVLPKHTARGPGTAALPPHHVPVICKEGILGLLLTVICIDR